MPVGMMIVWGVPCDIMHSKDEMKELFYGLIFIFIISFILSFFL